MQPATHYLSTQPSGVPTKETSRIALLEEIPETIKVFNEHKVPVVVILNPPVLNDKPSNLRKSLDEIQPTRLQHEMLSAPTDQIFYSIQNVTIFDPANKLCNDVCLAKLNGNWLYYDDNHLSVYGAVYFEPEIDNMIREALNKSVRPVPVDGRAN